MVKYFFILGANVRFISDEEVILVATPDELLKVNVKLKKSQVISKIGDDNRTTFTNWAKSTNFIATKASKTVLKILDFNFMEKAKLEFDDQIIHVFYLIDNLFLILTPQRAYKVNASAPETEKIQLENAPKKIYSGTTLKNNCFFLHIIDNDNNFEGRIYSLKGELISRTEVSSSLM